MAADLIPYGKPGFNLYADQRGRIIGSCAAIISLSILFVFLRLLSRKLSRAGFWWDDVFTVMSLMFSVVCCAMFLIGTLDQFGGGLTYRTTEIPSGFGRHIYIFSPAQRVVKTRLWLRDLFVFEILLHTAIALAKFAILAFYYRIFPIPLFRRLLLSLGALSLAYWISANLTALFQCHPIHYAWDRADEKFKGHCINIDDYFIGQGSVDVLLNFLISIVPIPFLWRLRTTFKQKMILTALFTLAGFVVLVSIIWVVVLSRLEQADVTWNYIDAGIWSALEPNMAVICACIPSLRPLVSVAGQGFTNSPLAGRSAQSSGAASSRRIWEVGKPGPSVGTFSQLDEPDDLRPLGHDVSVRGGRPGESQPDVDALEMSQTGINVRTEVILSISDRLHYNDRLF